MDVTDVERSLRALGGSITAVGPEECLCCYLARMLEQFGCDGRHRFTERWLDAQPRPLPGLIGQLEGRGGYCDCEVVFNVFMSGPRPERSTALQCRASYGRLLASDDD